MKSTSTAKITNNYHQYLLEDHQVPPTCPNVAEESKKSWYIDYWLQKSVEIIFPLRCPHCIFLDETAVHNSRYKTPCCQNLYLPTHPRWSKDQQNLSGPLGQSGCPAVQKFEVYNIINATHATNKQGQQSMHLKFQEKRNLVWRQQCS